MGRPDHPLSDGAASSSATELRVRSNDAHTLRVGERRLLFHIPSSALFELDAVSAAVLETLEREPGLAPALLTERMGAAPDAVAGALDDLAELGVVEPRDAATTPRRAVPWHETPLTTLVLNVNTGCNLSCSYCYKEDLQIPAQGERLDASTAFRGVDQLLAE